MHVGCNELRNLRLGCKILKETEGVMLWEDDGTINK